MNSSHKSSAKTAVLYRMVMPDHTCPYGLKSKDLLERHGFAVADHHHLTSRSQTDAFKEQHGVETTPQTFVGDQRVGAYDDLRRFFGQQVKAPDATSFQPVIALFGVSALMAITATYAVTGAWLSSPFRKFAHVFFKRPASRAGSAPIDRACVRPVH